MAALKRYRVWMGIVMAPYLPSLLRGEG